MANTDTQKEKSRLNGSGLHNIGERAKDPGFWQEVWEQARLIWRLVQDPEVPLYLKLIPLAAVVYLISPIDLLPDMALGLGQLDDFGVILLGVRAFMQLTPAHIIEKHRAALRLEGKGKEAEETLRQKIVIDGDK